MILAYNKEITRIGDGLYEIDCTPHDVVVLLASQQQKIRVPFSTISYRCGSTTQCKPCAQFDKCYPARK
jgi:hypothetical protein